MTQRTDGRMGEVRQLLEIWGRWASGTITKELDYPTQAPFVSAGNGGRAFTDWENLEARQIEQVMCALKDQNPIAFRVLSCHYVKGLSNLRGAINLNMSKARYQWTLGDGEHFVLGAIIGARAHIGQKSA